MELKRYRVTEECIACQACVEVAPDNFQMGDDIAFVKDQPENKEQEQQCEEAMEACPVGAIERVEVNNIEPVLAKSNVKETIDKYPKLKDVLLRLSGKFKRLLNPVVFNTVAKYATFNDAARVTGVSLCEILHSLNNALGVGEKLHKMAPDCIKSEIENLDQYSEALTWTEPPERYIYNEDTMVELIEKITNLPPQKSLVLISVNEPFELVRTAKELGLSVNIEKGREYRVSIFNPQQIVLRDWREKKDDFPVLDVRTMRTDPFDLIISQAYKTPEGSGFTLVQRFQPVPIINMLSEMGFDYYMEVVSPTEVWVYFYKAEDLSSAQSSGDKVELVIQSATPVAYPVIMRLLQSDRLRSKIKIKELKVWDETEKHLAWITSGKADISFSALITSLKLQKLDIKIPAMFVWDNFVILTRKRAKTFADLQGETIYAPLFAEAPPAKITRYLIKASGLNPDDFTFKFGEPFGRPEEIYQEFVVGEANTVLLREPEASYAIKIMQDRKVDISVLSFNEIWNEINPGFGSFPNAGVVLKGDFVRNNPELTAVFLDELKNAINWVNNNKDEAANLAFDMMRQPPDRVRLFLDRVNYSYVSGDELIEKVKQYFNVLIEQNIIDNVADEHYYEIFRM